MSFWKKLFGIEEKPVMKWQTNCVWNSVICAATCGQKAGYEVRIAITHIKAGEDHAQAMAKIDGKWTWLTEIPSSQYIMVQPYQSHYPDKEPYRYLTLADWLRESYQWLHQKEGL